MSTDAVALPLVSSTPPIHHIHCSVIAPELVTSFEAVKNHPKLAAYFAKRTEVEAAEAAAKAATAAATATA